MNFEIKEMLYEGKAKQVFNTSDPSIVMVHYKDEATAMDGAKKGIISNKGIVNNKMSNLLMQMVETYGIKTHYVKELNDRDTLVKKLKIIPLEVIIRNIAAGSFSKRMGVKEGSSLRCPILEFSYKNDELHDPFVNNYYALALDIASQEEIDEITDKAFKINNLLQQYLDKANLILVDFKLEFGKNEKGNIFLADEISPDTCRLWDKTTGERLDKDLFRKDLGGEVQAYEEVMRRISSI